VRPGSRPGDPRSRSIARPHAPAQPARADPEAAHRQSLGATAGRAARALNQRPQLRRRGRNAPAERVVTAAAILRGDRVLNLLTRGNDAVVAALTGRRDADVTEGRLAPRNRAMARAAILGGRNVSRRLARRQHAVVAARAARRDTQVLEAGGQPRDRPVAVLARVVARDVGDPLTRSQHAVVAVRTVGGHAGVGRFCNCRERRGGRPGRCRGCADDGADGALCRGRWSDLLLRRAAAPVVGTVAAVAVLAHVVAVRPRGQIGHAVELQGRQVVTLVAGTAGHGEHRGVLGSAHRGAAERCEADGVATLARRGSGGDVHRRQHGILGGVVQVEDRRRRIRRAVTGDAATGDASVQDGIGRKRCRRVIARRLGMTQGARLVGGIRHMARRHGVAVPVCRGVATTAVSRQHAAGGVIGRAQLQRGAGRADIETHCRRPVARIAGGGHERVRGLGHVHRAESAHRVGARGMTRAAVGAGEIRDVRGRKHRILGREVVVPGERGGAAVALAATAADAGVQYRIRGQGRVVRRCRGVARIAGCVRRVGHMARRHGIAVPVCRGVATTTVSRQHGAGAVIGRAQLQRGAGRADIETHRRRPVARRAGGGHERMRGLGHVHRPESAHRVVARGMAGTAVGA